MSLLQDTKKMYIYIDETSSNDGEMVMLGAIYIPEDIIHRLNDDLGKIRKRILKKLKEFDYPVTLKPTLNFKEKRRIRLERPRIISGGWPEIHAQEMWNGDGVFYKDRSDVNLFERNIKFLKEVLDLYNRNEIFFRTFISRKSTRKLSALFQPNMERDYAGIFTEDVKLSKFRELYDDIYVQGLSELLITIEEDASINGWDAEIICDAGQKTEIFRSLEAFSFLKSRGYFSKISSPRFIDSASDNALQLCDTVTFIYGKLENLVIKGQTKHRHYDLLEELTKRYIDKRYLYKPVVAYTLPSSNKQIYIREIFALNILLLHSGGSAKTLGLRRKRFEEIAHSLQVK